MMTEAVDRMFPPHPAAAAEPSATPPPAVTRQPVPAPSHGVPGDPDPGPLDASWGSAAGQLPDTATMQVLLGLQGHGGFDPLDAMLRQASATAAGRQARPRKSAAAAT